MAISFSNSNITFSLKAKTKIKNWISEVAKKEKKAIVNLSYVFTSDEDLLTINKQYLNHNTYTDIITFDYTEGKAISGEIFISVDRVKENSQKIGTTFEDELHRVIIHGVLHLCGHKDKTKIDSDNMRRLEDKSLRLLKALK
jgi:probable rRNA maturation factor